MQLQKVTMQAEKMTAKQFNNLINHECGLLGVSETGSDMHDLLEHEIVDERAAEAVALFCYQGLCGQNIHLFHFDDEAKIIAFHRWDKQGPKDSVVVVVNMANQCRDGYVIGFPRAGLWKTRFNSDSSDYSPDFANHPSPDVEAHEENIDGLSFSAKIDIGPYSVVIYSQDN